MKLRGLWAVPAAALVLAACNDSPVAPPDTGGSGAMEYLSCQVDLAGGDLSCTADGPALEGGALGAIIGGQGVYVQLTSSSVGYDSGAEIFSANVRVKNLSDQTLGSADGATSDAAGVRIFFVDPPNTTGGSGTVRVANADGKGDFSGTGQDYFQYSQTISPGQTSVSRTWEWDVPSTVTAFEFMVGVSTEVKDAAGLEPGMNFTVNRVAADSQHSCMIDLEGQAWCWGSAANGKLGHGEVGGADMPTPQRVIQAHLRFASIATGLHHTCALDTDGEAWCWGSSSAGRLGAGEVSGSQPIPQKVVGGHTFTQLAVGRRFACAITVDQDLYCWGANHANYSPLGEGTTDDRPEPHPVSGGHKFTWIGAGKYHACGITTTGDTYCWGNGGSGRLGYGADESTREPALVLGGHKFVRVDGGNTHSCALTADGEAYCWGSPSNGRLGIVDDAGELLGDPINEPAPVSTDLRFVEIQAGQYHTCAISVDGKTYCWGSQTRGKTGNGETGSGNVVVPNEIVGGHDFVDISAGLDHNCAIDIAGDTWCWGRGDNGQIGNGDTSNTGVAIRVEF